MSIPFYRRRDISWTNIRPISPDFERWFNYMAAVTLPDIDEAKRKLAENAATEGEKR